MCDDLGPCLFFFKGFVAFLFPKWIVSIFCFLPNQPEVFVAENLLFYLTNREFRKALHLYVYQERALEIHFPFNILCPCPASLPASSRNGPLCHVGLCPGKQSLLLLIESSKKLWSTHKRQKHKWKKCGSYFYFTAVVICCAKCSILMK